MAGVFNNSKTQQPVSVVEIFKSIDGEGIRTGLPAIFVRFGGCNLHCSWCDTGYALSRKDGKLMTYMDVVTEIKSLACKRITFTGGEPMLEADFVLWFLDNFPEFEVNVETNGAVPIQSLTKYENVIITMDYKCPSSRMTEKMLKSNFKYLRSRDVLKFVVADDFDLNEAISRLVEFKPKCSIYFSPVFGKMDLQKLAKFIIDYDYLGVRMGLQIHKIIWDPNKRGV